MVTTAAATTADDALFDRKIAIACEGLRSYHYDLLYKIPLKENALTLASYVISKSEINQSYNYRIDVIEKISRLSIHYGKSLFKDMTREQILDFLDHLRKPEALDPLHKWIGTYNLLRIFFIQANPLLPYLELYPVFGLESILTLVF
jgi:hypothetical protein